MELEIRRLTSPEDMERCSALQGLIWGLNSFEMLSPITWSSLCMDPPLTGLVLGGFIDEELVGFQVFLATLQPGLIYGHMLGITPERQGGGLAQHFHLNMVDVLQKYGIEQICWTYEPLEGRNAHSYLNKLGGEVRRYLTEHFHTRDDLNRGLPLDRFMFFRTLSDPPPVALGMTLEQALAAYPLATASSMPPAQTVLVRIPGDLQRIKREDPAGALAVRQETRAVFSEYLNQRGYVADRLLSDEHQGERRNYYRLRKANQD